MNRRLPIKQIQDIPVSAYNGNVLFFNQDVVTFCNTTTKTLLGSHTFNTANYQPGLNRVAAVTGYGEWQTSSAVTGDKLFIAAKLVSGGTTTFFEEIVERTQATFATGFFRFEVLLNVMTESTITLSLHYDDTATGNIIKNFEFGGLDLTSSQIIVEVHGQMAANINPVSLNQAVISPVNRVLNPGFEAYMEQWVREPENNTNYGTEPHSGNLSCRIFSGAVAQKIDQENTQTDTVNPGYIYQAGVFQTPGNRYYVEFWHKNKDAYAYASTVVVPGYIDPQTQNFSDETESFSILSVYAFNSVTLQKGPLLISVKTGKTYQRTVLVHTAVTGFDAIYFEMSPATFRSSARRTAQSNLLNQVLEEYFGLAPFPIPSTDYAFLMAVDYVMQPSIHLDDVRVSEIGLPFNSSSKEIRLRQFTTQYVS